MSVNIDRLSVDLDVAPGPDGRAADREPRKSPKELREQLRPIVLEILRQELDRLQREHGR